MAWAWSHTNEAYDNVRANLHDLPLETLRVIYAEWKAHTNCEDDEGAFNETEYLKALAKVHSHIYSAEYLADFVYDKAEDLATCENGGYDAWVCPFGCHLVPFERNPQ